MMPLMDVQQLHLTVPTGHIIQKRKIILDGVSFSVQRGSSTAYLGTNGAGKTSTFRILCGLVRPDSGSVHFDGQAVLNGLPPERFGFMPEHPYFYKNLTPQELLQGLGRLSGMKQVLLHQRIALWAEKLDFGSLLHQRLGTCSKGQVQRVGLAQALMHQPDFVLLDEPLSGLDPIGRALVRDAIQDEMKRGATLLFSSHILSDAEAMCDQVVVLQQGQVAYSGGIHELLSQHETWLLKVNSSQPIPAIEGADIAQARDGLWHIRGRALSVRDRVMRMMLAMESVSIVSLEFEQRTLEAAFMDLLRSKGGVHESHT